MLDEDFFLTEYEKKIKYDVETVYLSGNSVEDYLKLLVKQGTIRNYIFQNFSDLPINGESFLVEILIENSQQFSLQFVLNKAVLRDNKLNKLI